MNRKRFSLTMSKLLPSAINKDDGRLLTTKLFHCSKSKSNVNSIDHKNNFTQNNSESIVFVWLNLEIIETNNIINSLQSINGSIRVYNDSSICFKEIEYSKEKIFLIISSNNNELISIVHDFSSVEAIFILSSNNENLMENFPKFYGVFTLQEKLIHKIKEILNIFEHLQNEEFIFEEDNMFFWRQLWKKELKNRKVTSNKHDFVETIRNSYRNNVQTIEIINEFDKSYQSVDVLNWCFRSSFPLDFLKHAINSSNKQQLNLCRFLFADATRLFEKVSKNKFHIQVYRGMKLSNEQINQFEKHIGKLVCTNGFFPSIKSRTNALNLASFPIYRSDLSSVLFEIDCESTDQFIEISNTLSSCVVFDICMAFRVMCVNRGQLTIIKLKTAGKEGKIIAQDYLAKHNDETIETLLDHLLTCKQLIKDSITIDYELEAKKYIDRGEIDLALIAYRRIYPVSARILNAIGQLCADKKGDYNYAFECYCQALKIQQQNDDDVSETLTNLGSLYYYRSEFDMSLTCHQRALILRETNNPSDSISIANNLIGISNIHWSRQQYDQAIVNGEQALSLQETLIPFNETSTIKTLAMIGNIYQDCGKYSQALDRYSRALRILDRTRTVDLYLLAEVLNNLGHIYQDIDLTKEALYYLERSVEVYLQILPSGHPDRVSAEIDLEQARKTVQIEKSIELENIFVNINECKL